MYVYDKMTIYTIYVTSDDGIFMFTWQDEYL